MKESRSNDPSVSHTYRPVVTNKLGRAYGFSVDNAHVRVDVVRSIDPNGEKKKKNDDDDDDERASLRFREFFLAVAVETNENGVVNDDAYEYEAVADPFLEAVAEVAAKFAWDPKRRERGE